MSDEKVYLCADARIYLCSHPKCLNTARDWGSDGKPYCGHHTNYPEKLTKIQAQREKR